MQFMSAMEAPSSPYLPSSWLAEILAGTLFKRTTEQGFFLALLTSYAMFYRWQLAGVRALSTSTAGRKPRNHARADASSAGSIVCSIS
jgi:hypothetical protein